MSWMGSVPSILIHVGSVASVFSAPQCLKKCPIPPPRPYANLADSRFLLGRFAHPEAAVFHARENCGSAMSLLMTESILRMTATKATLAGLPLLRSRS